MKDSDPLRWASGEFTLLYLDLLYSKAKRDMLIKKVPSSPLVDAAMNVADRDHRAAYLNLDKMDDQIMWQFQTHLATDDFDENDEDD